MSTIGDNIPLLSTTTLLTAGSTWTSSAVVLGLYNSLIIMVKTDQDGVLHVDWSGDSGVNWDATDSYNIVDTVSRRVVITTQQKTIRIRMENNSGLDQTYLRLFTYGVTTNNSSLVSLINSIDISNVVQGLAGGQSQITQVTPIAGYNFTLAKSAVATACNTNTLSTGFIDLWTGGNDANATCGVTTTTTAKYLFLNAGAVNGSRGIIQGRGTVMRGCETMIVRFVASFSVSDAADGYLFVGGCPPPTNAAYSSAQIATTLGVFGWFNVGAVKTNDNFCLQYGNATPVTRPNWNVDKCDGNTTLPSIDFTDPSKPNLFQVEHTPAGNYVFSILNPSTNKFSPIHRTNILNSILTTTQPECCLTLFSSQLDTPTTGTDQVRLFTYSRLTDLPVSVFTSEMSYLGFDVAVSGAAVNTIALRNSVVFSGQVNSIPINLGSVSISTDGLNPVTVTLLLDSVVAGGSWVTSTNLPVDVNSTATITPSSKVIHQFELGANDSITKKFNALTPLLTGYRPVSIQVTSKSTSDVRISLGFMCM